MAPSGRGRTRRPSPETGEEEPRILALREALQAGRPAHELELGGITVTADTLRGLTPVDWSGADLRGATFFNVDLSGSRFLGSDLSGAAFHNVNLMRARFTRCSGRGAVFTDVNLAYSDFSESDLRGSLFFDANMADISFKGAALEGVEVDAIRLSLNGGTHVLGLKEALRCLLGEYSYPYTAGVSGDAFWLSYYLKTHDVNWGGFAREVLRRGFVNFGFDCELHDEAEPEEAWEKLRAALGRGHTVVTPLHVTAQTVLGTGFGGSEWVVVTGIDRGDLLVNCLLGDGLRFEPDRFRRNWCRHHPLEEAADDLPIVYAMCEVGRRTRTPGRAEITRAGLASAVEVLTLDSTDKVAFGFDAYRAMAQDLQSPTSPEDLPPDEARRHLPWLGLGILHHHGSRWAVRDFLGEVLEHGDLVGDQQSALAEAHDLYEEVCEKLQRFLELLPWTFDVPDEQERREAFRRYQRHREEGADLLREAAARERDALARFRAILQPA